MSLHPLPQLLLLNVTPHGMRYPFGQLRSSVMVMSPPHPLPISGLLIPIRSALWFSYCVMLVRDLFPLRVLNCVNQHLIGASQVPAQRSMV